MNAESSVPLRVRWMYGFGSVAYGVKDNGFSYFLVFYYSQVLGLQASLAGLAILIAMVFDAISDPLVGYWSDHTHSRWGRRHPFMYASALPVSLVYLLLWMPPEGLSQQGLFIYLTCMAVLIRQFITIYEIPSTSIVAELTDRYDERTELLGYRYMFGWFGGLTMACIAWFVLFADTAEHPVGQLNPEAYVRYGIIGAALMFVSIMLSAIALHPYIPQLRSPPPRKDMRLKDIVRELKVTLSNRNFLVLFAAGLVAAVGAGVSTNFTYYIQTYFWEFTAEDIRWITVSLFASAALARVLAPIVTRRFDKKRSAIGIYAISILFGATPVLLRLFGWFPDNDSPYLFWILLVHAIIDVTLIVMFGIIQSSMLADIVEQSEEKTERREEGLFFAARTFAGKATSGVGAFIAGVSLDLIQFPKGAQPGAVDPDAIFDLGLIYGPLLMLFYGVACYIISHYGITRRAHDDRVALLRHRTSNTPTT